MFETKREDWFFIVPATFVWISALIVAAWDFIEVQEVYHFDFINIIRFLASSIEQKSKKIFSVKNLEESI